MEKPIIEEVFSDNGSHSHWRLINSETGENLWSEFPQEDEAKEFLEKQEGYNIECILDNKDLTLVVIELLERYHQAKLKLLGIADVVGRSEQCEHSPEVKGTAWQQRVECSKCGEK